jgi:hypothetical protein
LETKIKTSPESGILPIPSRSTNYVSVLVKNSRNEGKKRLKTPRGLP